MRICAAPLCDEAAAAWWHGAWCADHLNKQFGRVPMYVGKLEAESMSRRAEDPDGIGRAPARPQAGEAGGLYPFAPTASPAVLSEDELLDIPRARRRVGRGMSDLVVIVGGFGQPPVHAEHYSEDAELEAAARECVRRGHDWHTCAACGDISCLRCGLGEPR